MAASNLSNKGQKTRVFLVEDDELFLRGLVLFLGHRPDFEVVGTAMDGVTALTEIKKSKPDIVVIDVVIPGMDGLTLIDKLKDIQLPMKILVLSQSDHEDLVERMVQAGIDSYVPKSESNEEIYKSLMALSKHESYFSPKAGYKFFQSLGKKVKAHSTNSGPKLTRREMQIAKLLKENMTNKQISEVIGCSAYTVKCHKANLMRKLNLSSSAEVVAWLNDREMTKHR